MIIKENVPWLVMLFSPTSCGLAKSWPRILAATGFATVVTIVQIQFDIQGHSLTPTPFMILGFAIGLFLGFLNNTSFDRFWEGRILWGRLVNVLRSMSRQVEMLTLSAPARDPRDDGTSLETLESSRRDFIYMLIAYAHALRHELRDTDPAPDLARYLPPEMVSRLMAKKYVALALTQEAGAWIRSAWQAGRIETIHVPVLEAGLTEITTIQGSCERIRNTPIPVSYIVLCHRLVAFFCFCLPLGLVETVGYYTPLVVFLVAHAFFGLDAIGEQIENPFENEPHDLPLDAICRSIEISLLETSGEKNLPEPMTPTNGILM